MSCTGRWRSGATKPRSRDRNLCGCGSSRSAQARQRRCGLNEGKHARARVRGGPCGEHQTTAVVGDQGQAPVSGTKVRTDPPIPNRARQGRRQQRGQGDRFPPTGGHRPHRLANLAQTPEAGVSSHQFVMFPQTKIPESNFTLAGPLRPVTDNRALVMQITWTRSTINGSAGLSARLRKERSARC